MGATGYFADLEVIDFSRTPGDIWDSTFGAVTGSNNYDEATGDNPFRKLDGDEDRQLADARGLDEMGRIEGLGTANASEVGEEWDSGRTDAWARAEEEDDVDIRGGQGRGTDKDTPPSPPTSANSGVTKITIQPVERGAVQMTAMERWEEAWTPTEQAALASNFLGLDIPRQPSTPRDYLLETKYKPVARKILPINTSSPPANPNGPLRRPPMSRDPFTTPLVPACPPVVYSTKVSKERCDALDFGPEGWLSPEEENLYRTILVLRGGALAFEDSDRGLLKESYASPYIFSTKEHTPWLQRPLPIPKAILEDVITLVKERLEAGLYEEATSTYSGRWFVVQKKNGKFRLVHDLQELNKVTYRDAGLPPQIEEFIEEFMGCTCYSLVDIFGGYDQYPLDPSSRDMTAFQTPIGPVRLTRLPQGYTNSVAVYQRMMTFVMAPEIPSVFNVFIDDGGVEGPRSYYNNETIDGNDGIRRFIWEHAVTLERILFRLEEAGLTVSGVKMAVVVPELGLVGTNVSYEGRRMQASKLNKIARFPRPVDSTELRGFLGVCTFVRIWVEGFAKITLPLRLLLRKDAEWEWDEDCERAFEEMKRRVGQDILLKRLEYGKDAGEIIVSVDSSWIATGVGVFQVDKEGRRRPVRYESITFTPVESRYSQPKLELAGVAKALHRLQNIIWGQHFTLEVDALYLKEMFNTPELPNAAMTRWVRYILLFDFDFRHIAGKKHTLADGLSRARRDDEDSEAEDLNELIQDVNLGEVETQGWPQRVAGQEFVIGVVAKVAGEVWEGLREFLSTMERPVNLDDDDWRMVRKMAPSFFIADRRLWRRHTPDPQEVILDPARQNSFLRQLHDELGHRGRNETYRRLVERAWWPGISKDVATYVRTCDACQKRRAAQEREVRHATVPRGVLAKIHFDVVHIKAGPFPYFVSGRDDLTGWIEGRALRQITARNVAAFIEKDFIYRYGWFEQATVDGGSEFKGEVEEALRKAGIRRIVSAPYHPEGNARAEVGHQGIVNGLAKFVKDPSAWHRHIHAMLFADRISTSRSTGFSPYELLFGTRPILPIDSSEETWFISEWDQVRTREQLLEARTRQIMRMEGDVATALQRLEASRTKGVLYHDKVNAHRLRGPLKIGQLVLYQNVLKEASHGRKLEERWMGPYAVRERLAKGSYLLRELDGTHLKSPFPAKRLRRYFARGVPEGELEDELRGQGQGVDGQGSQGSGEEEEEEEDDEDDSNPETSNSGSNFAESSIGSSIGHNF